MSVVIDASVLVAAAADNGAEGQWALGILATDFLMGPQLVLVEAFNVLRRLELDKKLSRLEAAAAANDIAHLDIQLLPFLPFSTRIWELRQSISSYDAWYIAIAEQLDLPFATLDRRLARADGPKCKYLLPQ